MVLAAGAKAIGADFQNLEVKNHAPLDSGTTTSTTYTTTRSGATSPVGRTFVAPPSGKVKIHWACGIFNSGANIGLVSFQVRAGTTLGSGTAHASFSDNLARQHSGTAENQSGRTTLVTGLTPGNDYNVTLGFRVNTVSTGTFTRTEVIVDPCLA